MADVTIFARLRQDHDRHRALLDSIEQAGDDARAALFESFRIEVTAHAAAEEETLYATMLADPDLRHDAQHSVAEHKEIDDLLGALAERDIDSEIWSARFRQMRHRYLHHIDEEEEEMFPAAAEALSEDKAEALAALFAKRKPAERERAKEGAEIDQRE